MSAKAHKKASQNETAAPAGGSKTAGQSARVLRLAKATINRKEREKVADLVEREKWLKRLSF